MSVHVLLNLLNKLEKSDKMRGLLFNNEFNKFNNTRARTRMSDSIYHMTLCMLRLLCFLILQCDFQRK